MAPATTAYYPQLSTDLKRTKTRAARNATLLLQPLLSVSEQAGSGSKPLCARQRRRAADKKRRAQTTAQTALLAPFTLTLTLTLTRTLTLTLTLNRT